MYDCRKCGCSDMYIVKKGTNTGLYCQSCEAWQKWLNKKEVKTLNYKEGRSDKTKENKQTKNFDSLFQNEATGPFDHVSQDSGFVNDEEPMITIKIPLRLFEEIMSYLKD